MVNFEIQIATPDFFCREFHPSTSERLNEVSAPVVTGVSYRNEQSSYANQSTWHDAILDLVFEPVQKPETLASGESSPAPRKGRAFFLLYDFLASQRSLVKDFRPTPP